LKGGPFEEGLIYEGIVAGVCEFVVVPSYAVSLVEGEDVKGLPQDPNVPKNMHCADESPSSCQRMRKSRASRPRNAIKHHRAALRMPLETFILEEYSSSDSEQDQD
jgi:hypothetical protein